MRLGINGRINMEEVVDGKAVIYEYKCDVCKIGYLKYTGVIDTEKAPDMFQNQCSNCNNLTFNDKDYPSSKIVSENQEAVT
jgi:hypothetical protein